MKKILLFLFIINASLMFSQEPTSNYKYIFELEKTQQSAWKFIENNWYKKIYYPYIKKNKIILSDCSLCGELFIDLEATINTDGKMTIDAFTAKKCYKKMANQLVEYLTQYFLSIIFPENLRNLKIQNRLGIIYKC